MQTQIENKNWRKWCIQECLVNPMDTCTKKEKELLERIVKGAERIELTPIDDPQLQFYQRLYDRLVEEYIAIQAKSQPENRH